jgi:phage baseplate assembly protein W
MNSILSDYNHPGYVPIVTRDIIYSDLDMTLTRGSSNDIVPLTDIDSIKNSIRNLVLSDTYDRPFEPHLGTKLKSLLFENVTPFTAIALKDEIINVIKKHESRVSTVDVNIIDMSDENAYGVTVQFAINNQNPQTVEFIINRLR